MKRKEYGSDFHYLSDENVFLKNRSESLFYGNLFSLFFSGRVALFNILEQGINNSNWKKVYLPSFYCHELTQFIKQLPIEVLYYEFNPFLDSEKTEIDVEDTIFNVIVNVNFFGIKKLDLKNFKNAIQIEDITHSIVDFKHSQAHYCFASLRKELPVPVGGFCYSPKKLILPKGIPNIRTEQIAAQKLSAMFLKSQFLEGKYDDKDSFRKLFFDAENNFENIYTNASMPEIAKSVLYEINIEALLLRKHQNIAFGLKNLLVSKKFKINIQSRDYKVFGLIFESDNSRTREELRNYLVKNMIFPAVLWPKQFYQRDQEIESRILFVHMDYRYSPKVIDYIVNKVNNFIKNE